MHLVNAKRYDVNRKDDYGTSIQDKLQESYGESACAIDQYLVNMDAYADWVTASKTNDANVSSIVSTLAPPRTTNPAGASDA